MRVLERVLPAPASVRPKAAAQTHAVVRSLALLPPAALLLYFALSPQPAFAHDPFGDTVRHHVVIAAALVYWLLSLLYQRRLPRPTPFDFPLLAVALAQIAATAAAPDGRLGLDPTLNLLSVILLFYVLVDAGGFTSVDLQRALLVMAIVASIFALHSVWVQWQSWLRLSQTLRNDLWRRLLPPTVPRVANVGSHTNILAVLLTMPLPFGLLVLLEGSRGLKGRRKGWWRGAAAAGLILVEFAIFFTLARGAWAAQLAAIIVFGIGYAGVTGRVRLPKGLVGAASVGAAAVAGVATVVLVSGERPIWLFRPSLAPRADMRAVGLRIFSQHIWFGAGPGSYPLLYSSEGGNYPDAAIHSHNILIQTASDTGIVGLAAVALLAVSAGFFLWRLWRRGDARQRLLVAAVSASLTVFFVDGMGDSLHLFPEVLLVLATVMAIAVRSAREAAATASFASQWLPGHRQPEWAGAALTAALLLATVPAGVLWLRTDQAAAHYARSISLAAAGRWTESAQEAEQAANIDPTMPLYHVQAGVALEQAYLNGRLAGGRQQAVSELERALSLEPRSAITALDLGALLSAEGHDGATLALLPALRRDANHDSLVLLGAGVLVERLRPEEAIAAYASLLVQNPTLAATPFWQQTAFRRGHFQAIVNQALTQAGARSGSAATSLQQAILLYAGLASASSALPPGKDFASRVARGSLLTSRGDYGEAASLLRSAVAGRPDDPSARLAFGDVEAARGDVTAARWQWLNAAYLGDASAAVRLGDSYSPGAVPRLIIDLATREVTDLSYSRFYLAYQHYRFAYQRHEPIPIVLQGDWLNALPNDYGALQAAIQRWQEPIGHSTAPR